MRSWFDSFCALVAIVTICYGVVHLAAPEPTKLIVLGFMLLIVRAR